MGFFSECQKMIDFYLKVVKNLLYISNASDVRSLKQNIYKRYIGKR